jgi:integrase/recombinase XerD
MTVPATSTARIRAVFPGWLDLAGRVSSRTLAEYRYDATNYLTFCADWDVDPLDADSLRAWRHHMIDASTLSPNTINRRLAAIKRLVKASAILKRLPAATAQEFSLVENAQIAPLRHRLRPDARIKIQPPEMRALVEAPDTRSLLGLRDRALLATLAGSGCRIGEVVTLQKDHILHHTGGYMIEVLGKGQAHPRLAPLSLEAHGAIEAWRQARARYVDVQHIFTGFKGPGISGLPMARPLSAWGGWNVVKKYAKAIGLELKPHDLRRFVGTQLAARNLRSAQLALGHKRLETTAKHYILDELQAGLTDGLY